MAPAILKSLTAAAGLLASLSYARPLERRAVAWETVTDVVVKTVDVTTTVTGVPEAPSTIAPKPTTTTTTTAEPETTKAPPPGEFLAKPTESAVQPPPSSSASPSPEPEPEPEPTPTPTPTPTPEPEPEPEPEPTPTPTPTPKPKPTPKPTPKPSPPPSNGGGGGKCVHGSPCTGEMTFYGGGLGACGSHIDTENDDAIALPWQFMGEESNSNDYCGKTVNIKYNGVTSKAKVMDKCMGCEKQAIDMSRHLFNKFSSFTAGRVDGVEWWFD